MFVHVFLSMYSYTDSAHLTRAGSADLLYICTHMDLDSVLFSSVFQLSASVIEIDVGG